MNDINQNTIKDILLKANISIGHIQRGPTNVFIGDKQFDLLIKNDKLVVKEIKKIFCKKYIFSLSELEDA